MQEMRICVTVPSSCCIKKGLREKKSCQCVDSAVAHLLILKATERGGRVHAAFEQPWQWSAFAKKHFPAS